MSEHWMERCPAAFYADPALETFVQAPRYRQTKMADGGILQEANGPPFIDRRHAAGDIALFFAAEAEQCSGSCQGGQGPCRLSQKAFELLVYTSVSDVPRRQLT